MCVAQTLILGIPGAYLASIGATDLTTKINPRWASILGVTYTLLGILFAAVAGGDQGESVRDVTIRSFTVFRIFLNAVFL